MKLTAFILLFVFTLVQTAPAIKSICNNITVSIFNHDEEKGTENLNLSNWEELEEKKILFQQPMNPFTPPATITPVCFSRNKGRLPSPTLDRFTPPPNIIA